MIIRVLFLDYHCAFADGSAYSPAHLMVSGVDELVEHTHYLDAAKYDNPRLSGMFYQYWGCYYYRTDTDTDYYVLGSPMHSPLRIIINIGTPMTT